MKWLKLRLDLLLLAWSRSKFSLNSVNQFRFDLIQALIRAKTFWLEFKSGIETEWTELELVSLNRQPIC